MFVASSVTISTLVLPDRLVRPLRRQGGPQEMVASAAVSIFTLTEKHPLLELLSTLRRLLFCQSRWLKRTSCGQCQLYASSQNDSKQTDVKRDAGLLFHFWFPSVPEGGVSAPRSRSSCCYFIPTRQGSWKTTSLTAVLRIGITRLTYLGLFPYAACQNLIYTFYVITNILVIIQNELYYDIFTHA